MPSTILIPPREHFSPKILSVLKSGYSLNDFRRDVVAGLTVAIVALPLSMAIAIASHTSPDKGLYTAIIGGFLISLFGGSRYQIGGPAGAFIVLLASIVDTYGYDGLLLATMMAGGFLMLIGLLRLGTYIRYVPHPVIVGFSAGIAVIIFVSQIKDLFGLTLSGPEPSELLPKLMALIRAFPSFNPASAAIAALSIGTILVLRKFKPHWPGFLIAVTLAGLVAWGFHLPLETIASRFGGLPQSLPAPHLPAFSYDKMVALLPQSLAIALLGGIESLLSAVVADTMSGDRHRSNVELVAQGIANIGCSIFGGITATGTIARTATNVRAGAYSPVSGILHSTFILLFMIIAAPLAGYIPLSALAAILVIVAWNMAEKAEFKRLLTSPGDWAVLLATFLLVILVDLPTGIVVGVVMGSLLFMHRMAQDMEVETRHHQLVSSPSSKNKNSKIKAPGVVIYRINGAYFFGVATTVAATLDIISDRPRAYVFDLSQVPFIDTSAAHSLQSFISRSLKEKIDIWLAGASPHVRRELLRNHIRRPGVHFAHDTATALEMIQSRHSRNKDLNNEQSSPETIHTSLQGKLSTADNA